MPNKIFFYKVTLRPLPLTYELDLNILPLDLHVKIQVRKFVHSAGMSEAYIQTFLPVCMGFKSNGCQTEKLCINGLVEV